MMLPRVHLSSTSVAALTAGIALALAGAPAQATQVIQHNLVSDGFVPADTIDPNLVNAWGVSYSPTSPFWVSSTEEGVSTIYTGSGAIARPPVNIFPGAGNSSPTGQVFNPSTTDFFVNNGGPSARALFLFATEEGTISGWSPGLDPNNSLLAVDHSGGASPSIYKGLAYGNDGTGNFLFAADFHNGAIERYNGAFGLTGTFTDPTLAPGYAPFNVQVLGGKLYATFALQDAAAEDEVAGAGFGYVDEFNLDGSFSRRIASLGDAVNAPWGLAIAPASFGGLAGDLLVGNFGDGTISAFDLSSLAFDGVLKTAGNAPLTIDGLWAILPGNGGLGGDPLKLYFSAGPDDESHGLFGVLTAVPEPATWISLVFGLGLTGAMLRRRQRPA
jgi:uncharacterized protein (TIGR03118 family)